MLIVGLTGGIASGKSEAARIFRELGARVIDADALSREVMVPHSECWQKVTAAFGSAITKEDLSIDREKLAGIVFADPNKRLQLNALVHPAILQKIEEMLAALAEEEQDALVVIDAALLVETGVYRNCDRVIVISASEEIQYERLRKRDGMSREAAQKRIDAQLPLDEKVAVADHVINNDGSLEELRRHTAGVFRSLLTAERPPRAIKKPAGKGARSGKTHK